MLTQLPSPLFMVIGLAVITAISRPWRLWQPARRTPIGEHPTLRQVRLLFSALHSPGHRGPWHVTGRTRMCKTRRGHVVLVVQEERSVKSAARWYTESRWRRARHVELKDLPGETILTPVTRRPFGRRVDQA